VAKNNLLDMRDARFVLYDQLGVEDLCGYERYRDHSKDTFEMIMQTAEKMAMNEFAPANRPGDLAGCRWTDGKVTIPEPFNAPFAKYCESGWICVPEAESVGGQNVPLSVYYICSMMFFAANHSLAGYMGLTHSAAKVIEVFGTDEQKRKYMEPLYAGRYAGGMNLTEPQAGSDVGAIRTKAVKNADGTYSITGGKIFITGGEQNISENIIHIVLARIEGDPPGTGGLSCFVVPKIRVTADGSLGEANDVLCAGIEHKMGMRGSATCVLNYGENGKCLGELLGPERKGISVMFHMMNEQRVLVGSQGVAQGSTAYLHAMDFARERKQGSEFGSKSPTQVPIIGHPDVKRTLLWMKAYTEGMRALILYTVYCMDRSSVSTDKEEKARWQDLVEVLTPVCKAYCTDRGFEVCVRAMQVHGGYGYCQEYPVEQFLRDCKITSIYEGTNAIQALDLFGRKVRMRKGAALQTVYDRMSQDIGAAGKSPDLKAYAEEVDKALSELRDVTAKLLEDSASANAYRAYSWATDYLDIFGDVVLGWMFLWQAMKAKEKLSGSDPEKKFYRNKIDTAKFYIGDLLPRVYGKIAAIRKDDDAIRRIQEWS